MTRPTTPTLLLRRLIASLRWGAPLALLALLAGGLPALALARPPADPTVTLINTGSGGLALLTDRDGRLVVIGGSAARTAASAALDRALPPWRRRLGLLLVPPPHANYLPGALDLLDRRPVGRASLLGLVARPPPALAAWQARGREEPVSSPAELALPGGGRLLLDPGDDPASGAALALVERGPVRLLLLFGAAAELAEARHAAGRLPAPAATAQLTVAAAPLPPALRPPVLVTLDGAAGAGPPRTLPLAAGQAVEVVLLPDRLRVQGEAVEGTMHHRGTEITPRVQREAEQPSSSSSALSAQPPHLSGERHSP